MTTNNDKEIYDTTEETYGVVGVGLVKLIFNGRNYLIWGLPKAWKWLDENYQVLPKRPAPTPQQFRHSWMRRNKLYTYKRK